MNKRQTLIAAALASVCAISASSASAHEDTKKAKMKATEKCYGVAKAGHNDCASANGSHSCAGQAATDKDMNEWKKVAKGTCVKAGGKLVAATK